MTKAENSILKFNHELIVLSFSAHGVEVKENDTAFSVRKVLQWKKISETNAGIYSCRAKNKETNEIKIKDYDLRVVKPEMPKITDSNFKDKSVIEVDLTDAVNLTCEFSGVPRPKLIWYKYENGEREMVKIDNKEHMCLENDGKMLRLKFIKEEDERKFQCEVSYDEFSDQRSVTIKISTKFTFLCVKTFLF